MYMKDNNEVKNTQVKDSVKESTETIKKGLKKVNKALKDSWRYHKGFWIAGIVILVIAILFGVGASLMNNEKIVSKITTSFIPDKLEADSIDDEKVTFYSELNPDYDGDKELTVDNLFKMYNFYYLNEDGEKVYLQDGLYTYNDSKGEEQTVIIGAAFLLKAGQQSNKVKEALKITAWVVVAVFIVAAIVVWYIQDKKARKENKVPIVHKKKSNK